MKHWFGFGSHLLNQVRRRYVPNLYDWIC